MTTPTVDAGTLHGLSRLAADNHPVLSMYVDLDVRRFATPAARETEIAALLADAGADPDDTERVQGLLHDQPELLAGAPALAIFSSAHSGALEAVPLPEPVEPLAVVDTVPWLEPLAAMLTSDNWGVAVVSRRIARLFRGGPGMLVEFATIDDDVHGRHSGGGWAGLSQSRFARGIEQEVAWHVEHAIDGLALAHAHRAFDHIVIVASAELAQEIEAALPAELRFCLAGNVPLDLEDARADDIVRAVAPVVEAAARSREQALLRALDDALGTGGPAAAGLDEVLAMLEQGRVSTLLVSHGARLSAGLCPRCGRLTAASQTHCLLDGAELTQVDAVEHAVEVAARAGVDVVVVHYEVETIDAHGSIAALLRW